MFFKVINSKGYQYLKLVHSYRQNKKINQDVIFNFGRLDQLKNSGQLKRWSMQLSKIAGIPTAYLEDMEEVRKFCYGDLPYNKLWNKYKFSQLLRKINIKKKTQFDFIKTIYLQVIDRLLSPQSKLSCFNTQHRYINIEDVELQHIYRSLDILADSKEQIEEYIFNQNVNLFNMQIDIVFYDVTTFHFESVKADELKDFGFSKAGKFNEVQVVMGLLVDMEGRPIGFDLFPGNTPDSNTFLNALNALKQRFSIRRLIFVADKGINSNMNLHLLKNAGYEYIVSARIKNSSKKLQNTIFSSEQYNETRNKEGKLTFKYKIINENLIRYKDEQGNWHSHKDDLIITWSSDRAERDRKIRERQIKKANESIKKGKKPDNKKGHKRYIALSGEQKIIGLDEEQIKKDVLWDGYYGIQTSEKELDVNKIIDAYYTLWKIEDTFKLLKSTMRTRPIFHWTPKRILGHFVMCFIALVLERALEIRLKINQIEASPNKIQEALNSMMLTEIKLKDEYYYLKSKLNFLSSKILSIFHIRQPRNITPKAEFNIG